MINEIPPLPCDCSVLCMHGDPPVCRRTEVPVEPAGDSTPITERESLLQKVKVVLALTLMLCNLPELHVSCARTNNPAGSVFCKGSFKTKTGWSGVNAVDLYSVRTLTNTPAIRTEVFRGFPQSMQDNSGLVPRSDDDHFHINPFQFIFHQSSYHSRHWDCRNITQT
jgi:hypothetical protein